MVNILASQSHSKSSTIVIGLGGTASNDGGRGFIEALAHKPRGYIYHKASESPAQNTVTHSSSSVPAKMPANVNIDNDTAHPAEIMARSYEALQLALQNLGNNTLIAASDVDNCLLGENGAIAVFGRQKGADAKTRKLLESRNFLWSESLKQISGRDIAILAGTGAAGGLGAAILALGGKRVSGSTVVKNALDQASSLRSADLVITGEGKFDKQSLRGKVVISLAHQCQKLNIPIVVIAGQVQLTPEQYTAAGITKAYSMSEHGGNVSRAMTHASHICTSLASRIARDYTRGYITSS